MKSDGAAAHGGGLVSLIVDEERAAVLKEISMNLPDITLNDHHLCDLELLATGTYSPLEGFMVRADYESVLDRMRIQDNTLWPLPICLDVSETKARSLEAGQSVALRDPEGFLLAVMHIEDIWPVHKEKMIQHLFETDDQAHPGIYHILNEIRDYYVGGRIEVISLPLHYDFRTLRKSPYEVRLEYQKHGWKRIVGYHTSSVMHRPQFEVTIEAMRQAKANLLLLPIVGVARSEDFDYYTRVRCYKEVIKYYPPDTVLQSLLPQYMRLAGTRETILNAIVLKNYGCTHFVVYPEHAVQDNALETGGQKLQANVEARDLVQESARELGIDIIRFEEMAYLPFEDKHQFIDQVPEGTQTISMNGVDIRNRIRTGRVVPGWASFPQVLDELRKAYPPPNKQGFTLFFTGLSGAGKSTVAKVVFSKMLELGERPVTLLDGDIVRQNLSSELSFSKEHRDINVRRIGFVASEITKNRGIAICAPIAPYENTRKEIRAAIEATGGFLEIHVATPLQECEKRDRKGMYAKARAGLIKGYTGIDDPYEVPSSPELRIDTTALTPDEAAHEILLFLGQKGYI
ncbi:MAG: bifunctional sulfate adenylyltransferase/adenylylsulfate kinase [Desulfatitalea sp.]|nr:bifunctional sulfate adenylyltransferase/adenylylsulfate kinase [Desulfatitalea sp.]NNK00983.1 bifunctional sulfate adenylyltransferase/adenylylsulfate kinase [Desulfatitalea sp.]